MTVLCSYGGLLAAVAGSYMPPGSGTVAVWQVGIKAWSTQGNEDIGFTVSSTPHQPDSSPLLLDQ